jgi:release factor glutamine methyltransferase
MLVKQFREKFKMILVPIYDEMEVNQFFYLLLEEIKNVSKVDLALEPSMKLTDEELNKFEFYLSELQFEKPIQYLLGKTYFFGLPFLVNENVLIPRPETEELVELILVESRKSKVESIKILDIGTGSGCIPISLKKNLPKANVFSIDVSNKAIETAQKNADLNQVNINFIHADILKVENLNADLQLPIFDVIVSNPPYVRNLEKAEIKKNVLTYEPHSALFVEDDDALIFYRKITELAAKSISKNGKLYFEINQYLGIQTQELVKSYGFNSVEILKDIYGNDRMISASYS